MSGWPPDPEEVRKHDEKAYEQRQGQKYNTPPPPKGKPATGKKGR